MTKKNIAKNSQPVNKNFIKNIKLETTIKNSGISDEEKEIACSFKNFKYFKFIPIHLSEENLTLTDSYIYSFYFFKKFDLEGIYKYSVSATTKLLALKKRQVIRTNQKLKEHLYIGKITAKRIEVFERQHIPPENGIIKIPSPILPVRGLKPVHKILLGEFYSFAVDMVYSESMEKAAKRIGIHRTNLVRRKEELSRTGLIGITKNRKDVELYFDANINNYFNKEKDVDVNEDDTIDARRAAEIEHFLQSENTGIYGHPN